MVIGRISRSGNSKVVVMPRAILRALNLQSRDYVTLELVENGLLIKPFAEIQERAGRVVPRPGAGAPATGPTARVKRTRR